MSDADLIPIRFVDAARPVGVDEQPSTCLAPTPDEEDDGLSLLGLSALGQLPERRRSPVENVVLDEALRALLFEVRAALERAPSQDDPACRFDLAWLDGAQRAALDAVLGDGEVTGTTQLDGVRWTVREVMTVGLWRISGDDGAEHLEVASVPWPVVDAARSLGRAPIDLPPQPPAGAMNAPSVLAEISDRAAAFEPSGPTEVVNFTLLPMSEMDESLLTGVLGRAELSLESGGFGICRVLATRWRHVWAVQYLNAMGHTILDTVEVGDVPEAVRAAPEDFSDSARRLGQLIETYSR